MTTGGGRKGPRLSPEDTALWDGVTRSVRPLRKPKPRSGPVAGADGPAPLAAKPSKRGSDAPSSSPVARVEPKKVPQLAALDRKTKQKIARGRDAIDGRIDLHGYTQVEAHDALLRFLRRSQARGARVVLVITGKGARNSGGRNPGARSENDRGVLKRAVPLWLALPDFRELVVGYDSAAIAHGGEGALYVRLRKLREA